MASKKTKKTNRAGKAKNKVGKKPRATKKKAVSRKGVKKRAAKKKAGKKARPAAKRMGTGKATEETSAAEGSVAKLFGARSPPAGRNPPAGGKPDASTVSINRAPVLTLWAAVVVEALGYDRDAALTLGKCVSGLNAQSKGRRLGIFGTPKGPERGGPPKRVGLGEEFWVEVCGRPVPAKNTEDGVRAVVLDKPIDPGGVRRYLAGKFGEALERVRDAMTVLAESRGPEELRSVAYSLYERFRPRIEPGRRGWGQKGTLDLELIRSLARPPAGGREIAGKRVDFDT